MTNRRVARGILATLLQVLFVLNVGSTFAMVEGKKVALVIGNSNYAHALPLPNPANDGRLVAKTLRKAGFSVIQGTDLNKIDMGRLLDEFTEAAFDADIALIYYAGHGLQVDGHNYLIPVDAVLEKTAQLQTRTMRVDDLLASLPPDPAVGIVILDACRDNPLVRTLAASLPANRSLRVDGGLAPVQASGSGHDTGGLLIAYATDPGSLAYDGNAANSPYTAALVKHLTTPGLEIQSALVRVRAEVSKSTNGTQRPWISASLGREVFLGGQIGASADQGSSKVTESERGDVDWTVEQKVWDEAAKRDTNTYYELYLRRFPTGRFAELARLGLDRLKGAETSLTPLAETSRSKVASAGTEAARSTSTVMPDQPAELPTGHRYAAFAVVANKGLKYHGFGSADSPIDAERAALRACGKAGCQVVQNYSRGECAVTVAGSKQIFWNNNSGGYLADIQKSVLNICTKNDQHCRLEVSICF